MRTDRVRHGNDVWRSSFLSDVKFSFVGHSHFMSWQNWRTGVFSGELRRPLPCNIMKLVTGVYQIILFHWNFHNWLHLKLSKWQLLVELVMKFHSVIQQYNLQQIFWKISAFHWKRHLSPVFYLIPRRVQTACAMLCLVMIWVSIKFAHNLTIASVPMKQY